MSIFDSLIYGTPKPSPIGTLSSLATMPFSTPGFGSGMGADNMVAPSTAAPPGPVSSDDSNSGPSTWQKIAGIVGDALLTGTGHQTVYGPAAQAYAKMQMDPTDKAYKLAQIAALQQKQPKVGEFQQRVNDLRANGATDDQIASLINAETNPMTGVQVHNATTGQDSLMFYPKGGLPGGPVGAAPQAAPDGITFTPRTTGGAAPSGTATFSPSSAYDAVIQQESRGRAGAIGPQTPYGRAQGLSQMLPATAQSMADKLGVPWQPDMMTGTTPDAAAYQRQLGQAYFEQGLAQTGNIFDAARYYHGGPSRSMWGPKTNAYANSVVSRLGGQ